MDPGVRRDDPGALRCHSALRLGYFFVKMFIGQIVETM